MTTFHAHINASIVAFVLEITSPSWDDKVHEVREFFLADDGTNALHGAARSSERSNKRKSCGIKEKEGDGEREGRGGGLSPAFSFLCYPRV